MVKNTFGEIKKLPFWNQIDLIHFHNLHGGYFNIFSLPKLSKAKKCIWTLHDPWIINDKEALVPEYKNIFKNENILFHKLKKISINNSNIVLVTPSYWLKDKITAEYPNKRIEVIHNGTDTKVFTPTDKTEARKTLNLPINKKIILFVANGGKENIEKGAYYLEIIKNLYKDILFIELGGEKNYIKDEKELALYYSAADILLFPSLAENLPLSILEAMSCGTPVVAFKIGGIPEIIDHKKNGYIAEYKNLEDIVKGIDFVLNHPNQINLGIEARRKIVNTFDVTNMINKYMSLYKEITKKNI